MMDVVKKSVADVDAVLLVVEPIANVGGPERALLEQIAQRRLPAIVVIKKLNTVEKPELLAFMEAYRQVHDFTAIVPVSARRRDGLDELLDVVGALLPEGPALFPRDVVTDQPERQVCAEIVREKLLYCLDKEVPHGTAVEVTKFSERDDGLIDLHVTIYCEKVSHKGIIIGKQGAMLKRISTLARADVERFMGTRVYLETWVKVKENWRDNANLIRSFGFDSES